MFDRGNNISFKKDIEIEKVVLLQEKGLIQIKFRAEKFLWTFLMHQTSF